MSMIAFIVPYAGNCLKFFISCTFVVLIPITKMLLFFLSVIDLILIIKFINSM